MNSIESMSSCVIVTKSMNQMVKWTDVWMECLNTIIIILSSDTHTQRVDGYRLTVGYRVMCYMDIQ